MLKFCRDRCLIMGLQHFLTKKKKIHVLIHQSPGCVSVRSIVLRLSMGRCNHDIQSGPREVSSIKQPKFCVKCLLLMRFLIKRHYRIFWLVKTLLPQVYQTEKIRKWFMFISTIGLTFALTGKNDVKVQRLHVASE